MDGTRAVGIELKSISDGDSHKKIQEGSSHQSIGRIILDNNRVLIREYVWNAEKEIVRLTGGRDVVIIPLESGRIRQTARNGNSKIERLVFGHVIVRAGDQMYEEEGASGSPKAIIIEIK